MHLIVMRHGVAQQLVDDASRALSNYGIAQVDTVANYFATLTTLNVTQILHSSLLRAKQTAQLVGDKFNNIVVQEQPGLLPEDTPEEILPLIDALDSDTILVGHLPFVSILSSILCGYYNGVNVQLVNWAFSEASAICFKRDNSYSPWEVSWMINPEMLLKEHAQNNKKFL